jgi:hypothetical protein
MDKFIRNGEVAVLFSPDYGAGWFSWGAPEEAIFDPELVEAVKAGDYAQAEVIAERKWPDTFRGGVSQLAIAWVPVGMRFRINEYDGCETVELYNPGNYITA